jgi:hypothetical protein
LTPIKAILIVAWLAWTTAAQGVAHTGQVTFGKLPLPGASVTATSGGKEIVTTTEADGSYRFTELLEGVWTVRVEMLGFTPISREVTLPSPEPAIFEMALVPFDEIARTAVRLASSPGGPSGGSTRTAEFQRTEVNAARTSPREPTQQAALPPDPFGDSAMSAADGLLINGSVNNGGASPFAQSAAFGNNRRGPRSLYNWGLGTQIGNSALDARPYSFSGRPTPKPDYTDIQITGTFGGPLRIPGLLSNGPTVYLGYQRLDDHNANTQSAIMPTAAMRRGDFSDLPITLIDPTTGLPFEGNRIPEGRISEQARSLLQYYPLPNLPGAGGFNFQAPVLVGTEQDSLQVRLTQRVTARDQLSGSVSYQRTSTDTSSVFGFVDSTRTGNLDVAVNWSRRFSPLVTMRLRYQHTRLSSDAVPYFAGRTNVSGEAGITGNDQNPQNWGPPALVFGNGIAGLGHPQFSAADDQAHGGGADIAWGRGRHYMTFGGGARRRLIDSFGQQDARGVFSFTGSTTGSDFADFLLGIPHSSSIAFGNSDKFLRGTVLESYFNDDWRLSPSLTLNLGVRWEYESPLTEKFGRLVNLDVTSGFAAVAPVIASDPVGSLTGTRYPASLVHGDPGGMQPRLGLAWRPVGGSSLVIRAGYGVYRNTNVYQSIALAMAQQPPLSKAVNAENSPEAPLTLANGFIESASSMPNTFGVDPALRVGLAQNWQVSAQRDLPASLTILTTYLGSAGNRLMQEVMPNTYPAGGVNPCPVCPLGFVHLSSGGSSVRHAGQLQLRRRLRNGLTATVQYTLARATDDAAALAGATMSGVAIAQDWQDPDAERAPSTFDQRHLLTAQFHYTTGVGVAGGALIDGVKGSLLKGWTITTTLTTGSGLPLTPTYLTSVPGTGVTGTMRADLTGAPLNERPDGYYLNPGAYTVPAAGEFGRAGRNSVAGPAQFNLNAGLSRTFFIGDRLNLDWRLDATNVLNQVTFAGVNTIVDSPQFGLPNRANQMRKIQMMLRLRY